MRCGLAEVAVGSRLLTEVTGLALVAAAKIGADAPAPLACTRRCGSVRRGGATAGVTQHAQPRKDSRRAWPLIVCSSVCSGQGFGTPQYLASVVSQRDHRGADGVLISSAGNANLHRIDLAGLKGRGEIGVRGLFECEPN